MPRRLGVCPEPAGAGREADSEPVHRARERAVRVARVSKDSTAPAGLQRDSAILPGGIAAWVDFRPFQGQTSRALAITAARSERRYLAHARIPPCLTLLEGTAYHPTDEERAMRRWVLGAFVCLMGSSD